MNFAALAVEIKYAHKKSYNFCYLIQANSWTRKCFLDLLKNYVSPLFENDSVLAFCAVTVVDDS